MWLWRSAPQGFDTLQRRRAAEWTGVGWGGLGHQLVGFLLTVLRWCFGVA